MGLDYIALYCVNNLTTKDHLRISWLKPYLNFSLSCFPSSDSKRYLVFRSLTLLLFVILTAFLKKGRGQKSWRRPGPLLPDPDRIPDPLQPEPGKFIRKELLCSMTRETIVLCYCCIWTMESFA